MTKLVTDGMTDLQIDVLKQALNSYADYCVTCAVKASNCGNDLDATWYARGSIADDMAKGIDK